MSLQLATRTLIPPDEWMTPEGPRWRPEPFLTLGPEVAEVCASAGFAPDPQQELMLDLTFAVRPDRSPLAFEVAGIATRQNLKTGWLVQSIVGFIHVLQIPEVMYAAHEMATAHDTQRTLAAVMLGSTTLRRHLLPQKNHGIYEGKVDERIELRGDRTVWFKTRTNDGGRGLAKPRLILDEHFATKAAQIGALGPIMLAQKHPQILYASSAPKRDSHELHDLMRRGRAGSSPRLAYAEWAAPVEPCGEDGCVHPKDAADRGLDCALDRERLLLHANPTAVNTDRISLETLVNLRQVLPPAEYARECLGWGEEEARDQGRAAIDGAVWTDLANPKAKRPKTAALYLDVAPDRRSAAIGLAAKGRKGRVLLMSMSGPGWTWLPPLVERLMRKRNVLALGLHPRSQASVLVNPLREVGVELDPDHVFTTTDLGEAWSQLLAAVEAGEIEHAGQPQLRAAVQNASSRFNGEVELPDRRDRDGADISPLVAVAGAKLLFDRHAAEDYDIEDSLL